MDERAEPNPRLAGLSPAKRALLDKMVAARGPLRTGDRPVGVVGIGCHYPHALGVEAFWQLLVRGRDVVGPPPAARVDSVGLPLRHPAGYLADVERFDAGFFGISPREACRMDPQHRLLLQVSWQAIDDAGLSRRVLAGSATGVYVSVYQRDFARLALADPEDIDAYTASGTHHSIAANRISYLLDLRGPSLTVDTACSSSLVAVAMACRDLVAGRIDRAVVAAANLMLDPTETEALGRWGMLAPDGRCKAFDARADGFVRGEGCVAVVLERADEAAARGVSARALIAGVAVNQDGRSNGLTAPSEGAQRAVIRAALADARLGPERVGYVEAHGTGTTLGDPIELAALGAVLAEGGPHAGCLVGSVKTNLGHLEAAAGLTGLVKAALCLERAFVPPSLHFEALNPAIELVGTPLAVAAEGQPWRSDQRRVAAVSAFGMGGTNAHVVLAQAGAPPSQPTPRRGAALLALSAADDAALAELAMAHAAGLPGADLPGADLHRWCAATSRRSHHRWRCAFVATDAVGMRSQLRSWLDEGAPSAPVRAGAEDWPGVVFVFPGQGSQWPGIGRQLLAKEPVFAETFRRCQQILFDLQGWSLLDALDAPAGDPRWTRIEVIQPLLFSLEVSLAALWRSWGVHPDAVLGHSMGEAAAAYVAGILDLDDAMAVIARRSALMSARRGQGAMSAINLPEQDLAALLDAPGHREISIAVVNSPAWTVVSGPTDAVGRLVAGLQADGVLCRPIAVDVASHNAAMDAFAEPLRAELGHLRPGPGHTPLYSSVAGVADASPIDGHRLGAAYWQDNLRQPVRFWRTARKLVADGHRVFIEMSPHPILTSALSALSTLSPSSELLVLGSTRRDEDEDLALLRSAARLYEHGLDLDWPAVQPGTGRCELPLYPFQGERFELPAAVPLARGRAETDTAWRSWLYQVAWHPLDSAPPRSPPGRFVLVGDDQGLAGALAECLRTAGHDVELEPARAPPDSLDASRDRVLLAPLRLEDQELADVAEVVTGALAHAAALELGPGRLWLVSSGAAGPDAPIRTLQACLWGVGEVVAAELWPRFGGLVDLDPIASPAERARALAGVLGALGAERRLALRQGCTFVPRIQRVVAPAQRQAELARRLRPDASYLITGGLGALGLQLAQRLAERGARHIVLAGRTALPDRATWGQLADTSAGRRVRAIQRIEALGASVHPVALDVGDPAALRSWQARWRTELRPPIRGVFHAAGVQHRQTGRSLDPSLVAEELHPKLAGTRALWETLGPDLDLLVLYSSAATLVSGPKLGGYTAANAFLDAFAAARRAEGHDVLALDWGTWGEGGMAAAYEAEAGRSLADAGLGHMSAPLALDALEACLTMDQARLGVMPVDWALWSRGRGAAAAADPYLSLVAAAPQALPTDPGLAELRTQASEAGDMRLYARAAVATVLRARLTAVDPRRPLVQLGLDSLMAVELRDIIEGELRLLISFATLLGCGSVVQLADLLVESRLATQDELPDEFEELVL